MYYADLLEKADSLIRDAELLCSGKVKRDRIKKLQAFKDILKEIFLEQRLDSNDNEK